MTRTHVHLLRYSFWSVRVQKQTARLQPSERRLAQAILSALHSRHAGITPPLAASLAEALLKRTTASYPAPWRQLVRRLRRAIQELSGGHDIPLAYRQIDAINEAGLLPGASFSYSVFELVQPLIERACEKIGQVYLFCEDDNAPAVSDKAYQDYMQQMTRVLHQFADQDTSLLPDTFWMDRAVMLQSLSPQREQSPAVADNNRVHPVSHLPDSSVFLQLKPAIPFNRQREQHTLSLADRRRIRDRRIQQAGADGIRMTTRPEDLHRMLLTEYLYPDTIRLDRMLNSGYWIIKKPPLPLSMRHALVAALMPGETETMQSAAFLKTCWFDFMLFLTRMLQSSDLRKSELRWLEGDPAYRLHTLPLFVREMPPIMAPLDVEQRTIYRYLFLKKLGWLPAFLNQQKYYKSLNLTLFEDGLPADPVPQQPAHPATSPPAFEQPLNIAPLDSSAGASQTHQTPDVEPASATETSMLLLWLEQAWKHQRDYQHLYDKPTTARRTQTGQSTGALNVGQFHYVHVMLLLPGRYRLNELISRETIRQRLGLPRTAHISVLWVPEALHHFDAWHFDGSLRLSESPFARVQQVDKLAGDLIQIWLDNVVKEMENA